MSRTMIEKMRRRPDLDTDLCTPIRLADGQTWHFPKPIIQLRPKLKKVRGKPEVRTESLERRMTWGDKLDNAIRRLATEESIEEQLKITLDIGGEMLLVNYPTLSREELEILFVIDFDESNPEASMAIPKAIVGAATGRMPQNWTNHDPKESADGSPPASESSAAPTPGCSSMMPSTP